jgi:hypothetical protein
MADVLVLLNPLDVSRRRRWQIGDEVALLAWIGEHEPGIGELERAVYVNGRRCTDAAYRTQPGDEVLIAFAPGYTAAYLALQAIIAYAVGYVLNKMFAPSKPAAGSTPQASQVYGIAQPKNAARLGQPIPAIYGSVVALPDFAAQPYTIFNGNDQYLHAVLCLGLGEFDIAEMLLGDTQASTLADGVIKYRVWLPSAHGSTFGVIEGQTGVRENVVSSDAVATQELVAPNMGGVLTPTTWYWKASNVTLTDTQPTGVQLYQQTTLAGKLGMLPPAPALGVQSLNCAIAARGQSPAWTGADYTATAYTATQVVYSSDLVPPPTYSQAGTNKWIGYFASCKPGQHGSLLEYDFTFPNGLFTADTSGNLANCTVNVTVEAVPIDANGNPTGGATQSFAETFTAKDNTPQRVTISHPVPSGRYMVRAMRSSNSDGKATTADHIIWAGLKFQLDPPPAGTKVYGNVTLVSVILKATNGVADDAASSMRFRVTRRLAPLGSGATAPSSNPADAFVDILCAAYGGARPVNGDELDLTELTSSRAAWAGANGFNAVFDQPSTVWEALGLAVQTVHAAPLPVGSRMSLIHDAVQPVRAQLFTDANIAAGSLKVTEQFDQTGTPAGIRVNWRDPTTFSQVALLQPPDAPDFTTIDLFGCTAAAVAQDHADLAAAKRAKQRTTIEFDTELEGLNVLPGDRIGVAAGMVKWAQGARVDSVAGLALTLSAPLTWATGATYAVQLRRPDGTPERQTGVTRGSADNVLVLASAPSFTITGAHDQLEATALSFGVVDQEVTDWTVRTVIPNGATVTLAGVNYDPSIYASSAAYTRGPVLEEGVA